MIAKSCIYSNISTSRMNALQILVTVFPCEEEYRQLKNQKVNSTGIPQAVSLSGRIGNVMSSSRMAAVFAGQVFIKQLEVCS